jgi:hypothetical protein
MNIYSLGGEEKRNEFPIGNLRHVELGTVYLPLFLVGYICMSHMILNVFVRGGSLKVALILKIEASWSANCWQHSPLPHSANTQ